jgi:hypothetical protein
MLGVLGALAGVLHLRRSPWAGVAAGLFGAMGLAVGLEALAFWLLLCGFAGLTLVRDGTRVRAGVAAFGLTTAIAVPALALAFNPARYVLSQACDQTALPVLGAAVAGGLGLALLAALNPRQVWVRLVLGAAAGASACLAFVILGPDCLRGPMAQVDPAIVPIWMGLVTESQTLPSLLAKADPFAARVAAITLLGLGALTILLTARRTLRWPVLFAGGLLVTAALLLMMQLRVISYAAAFSGPLIAAAMVTILRRLRVRREDVGAAMLASLLGVLAIPYVSGAAVKALGPKGEPETASAAAPGCYDPAAYAALAGLEPGLMAAPIDSGPFILASSRLSVLAAPYHRNGAGLLAAHELLADTPEGALARVRALKVRYVAVCPMGDVGRLMKSKPDSLAARLEKNETPPWLSQVKTESSVRAYQVKDIY